MIKLKDSGGKDHYLRFLVTTLVVMVLSIILLSNFAVPCKPITVYAVEGSSMGVYQGTLSSDGESVVLKLKDGTKILLENAEVINTER